jgi:hypothetical protein
MKEFVMEGAAKKARDIQRSVHLVASVMLLLYLFTPLGGNEIFGVMLRAMVVPVLAASGLLMWQWPRIRRLLVRSAGTPARTPGSAGAFGVPPLALVRAALTRIRR